MAFYHFTSEHHWQEHILPSGLLLPTDPNLFVNHDAKPVLVHGCHYALPSGGGQEVVWLLDDPEAPGDHGLTGTLDKRAVLLEVDTKAKQWLKWLTARKHDPSWVQSIIRAGGGMTAARHWYVYPGSIPLDRVTRITHTEVNP